MREISAVTGPFSYTGRYIAAELRDRDISIRGLVRRAPGDPGDVDCRSFQFSDPDRLAADLAGVRVLYNTYWIRFDHAQSTFADAVRNTGTLAAAARRAGVERIIHVSVSNPNPDSPFAYFRSKAAAEQAILSAGVPCSIIRPTLVFGKEDILINNIAWLLRRFHVFPVPRRGRCRVQPVFVGDVARLAVDEADARSTRTFDAVGPEVLTFADLIHLLAASVSVRALALPSPLWASVVGGRVMSRIVGDIVITREELGALTAETLVSDTPATAPTRLTDWLATNGVALGQRYTSELKRHWNG